MDNYIRESQWNTFVSNLQHQIKSEGAIRFIRSCITSDLAERCFLEKQYAKGLYVVAAVDYLCRISELPLYEGYTEMRNWKLDEVKYPEDIEMINDQKLKEKLKRQCMEESLPEFKRANIMEKGMVRLRIEGSQGKAYRWRAGTSESTEQAWPVVRWADTARGIRKMRSEYK